MKKYICPMGCIEPQKKSGNCSVCGMKLIEVEEENMKSIKNMKKQTNIIVTVPKIF